MIDPAILLPYVAACILFSVVPGPSVTIVVANSLAGGTRAGLLTILGTEIAMLCMVLVVALGLEAVMTAVSEAFVVIKLVGAAYLVWIGWKMFSSTGTLRFGAAAVQPHPSRYVWQGALVNLSNPKTLLFLGAFLPQFIDLGRPAFGQIVVLGLIVMAVASSSDCLYALLAGRARSALTATRVRIMSRISGAVLMAGGVWLALVRKA
jgi:threonine/homoserine/homoserine lactone efflux protein